MQELLHIIEKSIVYVSGQLGGTAARHVGCVEAYTVLNLCMLYTTFVTTDIIIFFLDLKQIRDNDKLICILSVIISVTLILGESSEAKESKFDFCIIAENLRAGEEEIVAPRQQLAEVYLQLLEWESAT